MQKIFEDWAQTIATIVTVILMVGGAWENQIRTEDHLSSRLDNLEEKFKLITNRIPGDIERFSSIDNSAKAIETRVDSVISDVKINDGKLIILEAEVKALQDEVKVVAPSYRTK
jgi:hypothetical protein